MLAPLQKDDKKVVAIALIIAVLIIAYFALQKFWPRGEPAETALNDASVPEAREGPETGDTAQASDPAPADADTLWDHVSGQPSIDVWLYGADRTSEQVASVLKDHLPAAAEANVHDVSGGDAFFIETWLQVVQADPPAPHSWVVLQWDDWRADDLATLESILRQLLHRQPELAVTVVSEGGGLDSDDVNALMQAYRLTWTAADDLSDHLPSLPLARIPADPLYAGFTAQGAEAFAETDVFHGDVEWRPLSADDGDNPFLFDQYYALTEAGSRVDYDVEGDRVGLVYLTDTNGGIGEIAVDGAIVGEISCYTDELAQQVMWVPLSGDGPHTLSIQSTGERDPDASDSQVFIAGVIVVDEA